VGTERVYDLEVSTDHSFLANGIFVHNSGPNLQQIPSTGSIYSKPIKKCFSAPKGYLMVGADFTALEAKIGALLTKDNAKISIYTQGYDSHSFNTYGYWPEKMPDIKFIPEGSNALGFKITQDGQGYLLTSEDTVELENGSIMTLGEYYEKCNL